MTAADLPPFVRAVRDAGLRLVPEGTDSDRISALAQTLGAGPQTVRKWWYQFATPRGAAKTVIMEHLASLGLDEPPTPEGDPDHIGIACLATELLTRDAGLPRDDEIALARLAHDNPMQAMARVLDAYATLDLPPTSPPGLRHLLITLADMGMRPVNMDWLLGAQARIGGKGLARDGDWGRGWRFVDHCAPHL